MAELQQQAAQHQMAEHQQVAIEKQVYLLMRQILSQEGRQRLENIRLVKPQFAQQIEIQLIKMFKAGQLRGATPLPDTAFKKLLEQITQMENKKEFRIKNL